MGPRLLPLAHPRCDRIDYEKRTAGILSARHLASRSRAPAKAPSVFAKRKASKLCLDGGFGVFRLNLVDRQITAAIHQRDYVKAPGFRRVAFAVRDDLVVA